MEDARKARNRLITICANPLFAIAPTVSTLVVGLVGGWVLWEARTGGDRLALAIGSLLVAMIATGALVALREVGRDRQQQEATGQLEAAIGDVREIAQTMPPRTFLSDFDRLYQRDYIGTEQQIRAVEEWFGSGQRTEEQRKQVLEAIDEMIRTVLDALLDLAWVWDEASTQPGVVYRVNIMRYLSSPELTVRDDWAFPWPPVPTADYAR